MVLCPPARGFITQADVDALFDPEWAPPGEDPTQAALDALFEEARRVRFVEHGVMDARALHEGAEPEEIFLLEVEGADVAVVRDWLRIRDHEDWFACKCMGDFNIELHGEAGHLETSSVHHGLSIRLARWSSDARLLDGPALLHWMADQGASGPLHSFEQMQKERQDRADAVQADT